MSLRVWTNPTLCTTVSKSKNMLYLTRAAESQQTNIRKRDNSDYKITLRVSRIQWINRVQLYEVVLLCWLYKAELSVLITQSEEDYCFRTELSNSTISTAQTFPVSALHFRCLLPWSELPRFSYLINFVISTLLVHHLCFYLLVSHFFNTIAPCITHWHFVPASTLQQ